MKARQAFADGLRHKFGSGSEELTYLHSSTDLYISASRCMMSPSMAMHWPHELANLQVEPPQVNGHVVELLPCPGVVVRPKVRSEPLCIPATAFSKKRCSHLHRTVAQAPCFPPTRVCKATQPPLHLCSLVSQVYGTAPSPEVGNPAHLLQTSKRPSPVPLCLLLNGHCIFTHTATT